MLVHDSGPALGMPLLELGPVQPGFEKTVLLWLAGDSPGQTLRGCTLGGNFKFVKGRQSAIFWGLGGPGGPGDPGGFAPHFLEGSPGPPGPPRPQK